MGRGKKKDKACYGKFPTNKEDVSTLADIIQVTSLGVFTWFGFTILGIVDVLYYVLAFSGMALGIISAFLQNGRCKVIRNLRVAAIILSILTAIFGLGIYGIEKVIEVWPLK